MRKKVERDLSVGSDLSNVISVSEEKICRR